MGRVNDRLRRQQHTKWPIQLRWRYFQSTASVHIGHKHLNAYIFDAFRPTATILNPNSFFDIEYFWLNNAFIFKIIINRFQLISFRLEFFFSFLKFSSCLFSSLDHMRFLFWTNAQPMTSNDMNKIPDYLMAKRSNIAHFIPFLWSFGSFSRMTASLNQIISIIFTWILEIHKLNCVSLLFTLNECLCFFSVFFKWFFLFMIKHCSFSRSNIVFFKYLKSHCFLVSILFSMKNVHLILEPFHLSPTKELVNLLLFKRPFSIDRAHENSNYQCYLRFYHETETSCGRDMDCLIEH